jgi:hypothetical protein
MCFATETTIAAAAASRFQEGKLDDLAKMLNVLEEAGYHKTQYFKDQVHSGLQ